MLLVRKQPNHRALLPAVHLSSHRRNPSAPPQLLAVQPTRTPGLLSLSKPPAPVPEPRRQRANANGLKQPRQRRAASDDEKDSGPAAADAPALTTTTTAQEKTRGRRRAVDTTTTSSTDNQHPSQRPQHRSSSHAAAAPRSSQRSQAEAAHSDSDAPAKQQVPSSTTTSPRKQRPNQQRTNTAPSSPIAAIGPPSGRLARRRARHKSSSSEVINVSATDLAPAPALDSAPLAPAPDQPSAPAPAPTNTNTIALAVPKPRRKPSPSRAHPTLSRSVPLTFPTRKVGFVNENTNALSDWDMPASIDVGEDDLTGQHATWTQLQRGGLRTAPLTKMPTDPFLSGSPPSPTTMMRRASHHKRSPSYPMDGAMFNMTFDDDDSSFPIKFDASGVPVTPPRAKSKKAVAVNRFLYAGSAFQNAPDASALPQPKFLSTP